MAEGTASGFDSRWGLCLQLHLPSSSSFLANKPVCWASDAWSVWMNLLLVCCEEMAGANVPTVWLVWNSGGLYSVSQLLIHTGHWVPGKGLLG